MAPFDPAAIVCSHFGCRRYVLAMPSSGFNRRPTAGIPALCRSMPYLHAMLISLTSCPYHEQRRGMNGIALLTIGDIVV
jgi:hypothetical protein